MRKTFYDGDFKTSKAIEFAIEKARIGNVLFSTINYNESIRVMRIIGDIFCHAGISYSLSKSTRIIEVFGNKIIFTTRDSNKIRGYSVFCAVIDDYNRRSKDEYKFRNTLICRLRQRIALPYCNRDYFINELFITISREKK